MEKNIKITFNANIGKLLYIPSSIETDKTWQFVKTQLNQSLSYIDKNISYNKNYGTYAQRKQYKDVCERVDLFNPQSNTFLTGLLPRVISILENYGFKVEIEKSIANETPIRIPLPQWLRPYQVKGIETMLTQKRLRVQSPTGSGKTIMYSYFIANFTCAGLIIVPTIDLLYQTKETLEKILGEPVGLMGDGKKDPKRITVGIVKTLVNCINEFKYWYESIKVLVVDECDTLGDSAINRSLMSVLINTDYRIGVSATITRARGDTLWNEGALGPTGLIIAEADVVAVGAINQPEYVQLDNPSTTAFNYTQYKNSDGSYYTPNQLPVRSEVYNTAIVTNTERNEFIINVAKLLYNSPKYSLVSGLVLVRMRAQGEYIAKRLSSVLGIEIPYLDGTSSSSARRDLIANLNGCKQRLAVTTGIFNKGQDIGQLGFAIIGDGGGSDTNIIQQSGRTTRVAENKTGCLIVDLQDEWEIYYMSKAAQKRARAINDRYYDVVKKITLDSFISEYL